jgi:hypothetical protein
MDFILDNKYEVSSWDNTRETILHWGIILNTHLSFNCLNLSIACDINESEWFVKKLLNRGASINKKDMGGNSAFIRGFIQLY